jgi:catechol 2,3-dioxygenase-like lactoylglutathione lyase family enzyme
MFNPDVTSTERVQVGGSTIPLHGARGPGHVAFRVRQADLASWRSHLVTRGVPIEAAIRWPEGGESVYVRDPAGNSVEFATSAMWGLPEW